MKHSVLIIGAGSIGALKPDEYDSPTTENILTHAHAVVANKDLTLFGIFDIDKNKASQAAMKWSTAAYHDFHQIKNMQSNMQSPDIVVIASPTETHYDVIEEVLYWLKPKLIICEKPFCSTESSAKNILGKCIDEDVWVVVNYNRHLLPEMKKLKEQLQSERIFSAIVKYTRGFVRDGCHAIDLLNYLFDGECVYGRKLNTHQKAFDDFAEHDLTWPAYLSYQNCPHVFFVPVDGRAWDIFEIEIFTTLGKYVLGDHGKAFLKYNIIPEPTYGNYMTLNPHPCEYLSTELTKSLVFLYKNCLNFLEGKEELLCTGTDALKVHAAYRSIK